MIGSNNKHLTVAVIIPAYNVEAYISRALDSVLAQSRPADEIIVVDDGSTDSTASQIKKYVPQVRYIHQANAGLAGARNTGINAATGDWIAFLDGDDEWLPDALRRHCNLVLKNPQLSWSCGNFLRCLCEQERRGPELRPEKAKRLLGGKELFQDYFFAFRNNAAGHPNTMFIKRTVFDEVGLFREDQIFAEDLDMWWRIAYRYPQIGYVAEPLAVYHLTRPGALTQTFQANKMKILADLVDRHLALAAQHGRLDAFRPVVSFLVHRWLRGMLFYNRPDDVKRMLDRFGHLLNPTFGILIRLSMISPGVTARTCHAVSRLVRMLRLRRRIVRPPGAVRSRASRCTDPSQVQE